MANDTNHTQHDAKLYSNLSKQQIFLQRNLGLFKNLTVMYGPIRHSLTKDLEVDPLTFQVILRLDLDCDYPTGKVDAFEDWLSIKQATSKEKLMVWTPPTGSDTKFLVKTVFGIWVDLPNLHN
jgi:hypothetical protein